MDMDPVPFNLIPSAYDIELLFISLAYLFVLIKFLVFLKRKGVDIKITRKLTHIGIGSMMLFTLIITNSLIAFLMLAAVAALFEFSSSKSKFKILDKETFEVIDRPEAYTGSKLDTTLFEISGLLTLIIYYFFNNQLNTIAAFLTFVWVDGMAAIIGMPYGRHKYKAQDTVRSIEGSFAGFVSGFFISAVIYTLWGGTHPSLIVFALASAFTATVAEAISPEKYDNMATPLATFIVLELLTKL